MLQPLASIGFPDWFKAVVDWLFQPTIFFLGSAALLAVILVFRRFFAKPIVIIATMVGMFLFFALAWSDPDFNTIITKPDNVPIIILLASVVFLTWLGLHQAVENDERTKRGEPTLADELGKKKVFTWPDLVYTEFICILLFTALLVIWSIKIGAPIEEPAASARTPNPSKAPWYFLGLQELLVYFDPWLAGVLLPGFIVVGLCAIPYLDTNPKGNGYYTISERPFAIAFFWYGFLLFWIAFVILGTFLRGPNWSFFGPFEYWDIHKLEPLVNVDLATYFWVDLLGRARPDSPLVREAPGIILLLGYFGAPVLLGITFLRKLVREMGWVRFLIFTHLLFWFGLVPIKMFLRWTVNLKYIVGIPEWFFNI